MEGHDHALTGGLAFAAVSPLLHVGLPGLAAGTVFTAGAALIPDVDEPHSTISRQGGFLTMALAHVARRLAGGHRRGTHSLLGVAVFTGATALAAAFSWSIYAQVALGLFIALLLAAGLHALHAGGHHGDLLALAGAGAAVYWHTGLRWVPLCVALGAAAHIAGDCLTHSGVKVLWPFSGYECHLLPERARFTTGKAVEHWLVSPLLALGLVAALVWVSGYGPELLHLHPGTIHTYLAGHVGR